jgi:hypothetical protein
MSSTRGKRAMRAVVGQSKLNQPCLAGYSQNMSHDHIEEIGGGFSQT